jgi:hypothetical protein
MLRGILLTAIAILTFCIVHTSNAMAAEAGIKGGFQGIEGFRAGGFFTFDLGNSFKLVPELNFTQRKYRYSGYLPWTIPIRESDQNYDIARYIEVPILIKYVIDLKGSFKPVLFTGGYAAFRVSKESRYDDTSFTNREYKSLDGGLVVGGGFEIHKKNVKFHLDFRFNLGLVNIQHITPYMIENVFLGEILANSIKNKNRSIALTAGISF